MPARLDEQHAGDQGPPKSAEIVANEPAVASTDFPPVIEPDER